MAKQKEKKNITLEEKLNNALVPSEEQPYEVPQNWCWVRLGYLVDIKGGKRLPKGHNLVNNKTSHPYIRVTDFDNYSIDITNIKYLTNETYDYIKNYTISCNDLYISIAGTIGKVGLIPEILDNANLTENAAKITSINNINKIYLLNILKSEDVQNQIKDSTVSTSQPKLALFRIEQLRLPLPPLPEQQRIVDLIERLFAKLDEAKEKVQTAIDSFELRKAAILHKAFTGKLTAKWREENGRPLSSFASQKPLPPTANALGADLKMCPHAGGEAGVEATIQQDAPPEFLKKIAGGAVSSLTEGVLTSSADQPYPIPETWQWVKLGKIGILERGRSKHRPRNDPKLFGGVYPFIQTGDISNAGMYIYEHKQTLSEIGLQQSKLFSKGTLCITIAANIGKVSILTYDCCFPDSVVGFTPNDNTSSEYIYYMMDNIQKELESSAPATAQKNFNLKRLNDVAIPLPPLPEQKEIVRILDTLLAKSDKAKELAENSLENIETLKKTILAKAFRGLLGTNRADEASSIELLKEVL